jgi:hypothetical protein
MSYLCLVCGYSQMPHPPRDYNICPCCGVEYGLDDVFDSHEELRNQWLRDGARWFSGMGPYIMPPNWDAWEQLDLSGYSYVVPHPPTQRKTDQVVIAVPENIELRDLEPRIRQVA